MFREKFWRIGDVWPANCKSRKSVTSLTQKTWRLVDKSYAGTSFSAESGEAFPNAVAIETEPQHHFQVSCTRANHNSMKAVWPTDGSRESSREKGLEDADDKEAIERRNFGGGDVLTGRDESRRGCKKPPMAHQSAEGGKRVEAIAKADADRNLGRLVRLLQEDERDI